MRTVYNGFIDIWTNGRVSVILAMSQTCDVAHTMTSGEKPDAPFSVFYNGRHYYRYGDSYFSVWHRDIMKNIWIDSKNKCELQHSNIIRELLV